MPSLRSRKGLLLIALFGVLFAGRALAQFEVAPDHFDSAPHKYTANKKAKAERAATPRSHNVSVTPGSAMQAGKNGGTNASSAAQHRQPGRNLQQRADQAQVAATHRNHNAEEPSVAIRPQ